MKSSSPPRRRGPRPGTPRGQRMTRRAREQQLIDVALSVFAEQGYQETTVEDIASRAGITKPVIYDHFGSKEGLLSAVVQRISDELGQTLLDAWASLTAESTLEDVFRVAIRAYVGYLDTHHDALRCYQLEFAVLAAARQDVEALRRRNADLLAERFRLIPAVNQVSPDYAGAVAEIIIAVVETLGGIRLRKPAMSVEDAVDLFMGLIWTGFASSLRTLEDDLGLPHFNPGRSARSARKQKAAPREG